MVVLSRSVAMADAFLIIRYFGHIGLVSAGVASWYKSMVSKSCSVPYVCRQWLSMALILISSYWLVFFSVVRHDRHITDIAKMVIAFFIVRVSLIGIQ